MSIKTDFLKDCMTGNTITVQEIINMKNQINSNNSSTSLISDLQDKIDKIKTDVQSLLEQKEEEILDEVDAKISVLNKKLEILEAKYAEIYNKVIQFKYLKAIKFTRNANNDITRIDYENGYFITVDYINFAEGEEYLNFFPSKINYYDNNERLLAQEEIRLSNDSISFLSNSNF